MVIRRATGGDVDGIALLLSKSFLEDTSVIRVSIENNPRYSLSDMYVLEDKRAPSGIAGCLRITPFEVVARGARMPMAGIAAVAVQPEARRRGIAEAMVRDALRRMHEMNYPVSMLFPFRHDFYRKFGYAYVGGLAEYEFSANNLIDFPERSNVRSFIRADRSKVKKVLKEEIQSHGSFTPLRNDNFWEIVVLPKFKDAYVYDDGEVKGYLVCEARKESNGDNGSVGGAVLTVKEFVGIDGASHKGLWSFVGSLGDQVERVRFLSPTDYPFHLYLKEPRAHAYRRLFFEYKSFSTLASGFMLRVIDVPLSLSKLRCSLESPVDFVMKIDDEILPENSRKFRLHIHAGETIVEETQSAAQFEADVAVFSQIYSGFLRPSDAVKYGFASTEKGLIPKLDELFHAPDPFVYQFDIF